MSKKKTAYEQEDAALAAGIESDLTAFKGMLAAAEDTKDAAQKILKLRALDASLSVTKRIIINKVNETAEKRGRRSAKSRWKRAGLVLATLPIVTLPFTMVYPTWHSVKSEAEKLRALRERLNIDNFENTINDYQNRVSKLLNDTVRDCDLREISKSPYFSSAVHSHWPLKQKFDAAAIARAALGDEQPQKDAAPEKPAPATRDPRAYPQL